MDLRKEIVIKSLNKVYRNKMTILEKIDGDYPVNAVSFLNPNYQIDFPVDSDLSIAYEEQLFYIKSNVNTGFNFVETVDTDLITVDGILKPQLTQGILNFYNASYSMFSALFDSVLSQVETFTGQSFHGRQPFTEYLDGSGNDRLLLGRKKVQTIDSIVISKLVYNNYFQQLNINVVDLDVSEYQNKGILRIVPKFVPDFYSVKYFPRLPLQVRGTYGYDEIECPTDVKEALSLLLAAFMLMQDGSEDGGLSTFSIDAYSESYTDSEGRFAGLVKSYRSMAWSMLTKYKTGIR